MKITGANLEGTTAKQLNASHRQRCTHKAELRKDSLVSERVRVLSCFTENVAPARPQLGETLGNKEKFLGENGVYRRFKMVTECTRLRSCHTGWQNTAS